MMPTHSDTTTFAPRPRPEQPTTRAERRARSDARRAMMAQRRAQVVALRLAGADFAQIGAALDPPIGARRAQELFTDALARSLRQAGVDEARRLQVARYEKLLRRWWPEALRDGNEDERARAHAAMPHIRWILGELNKLTGAYAPIEVEAQVTVTDVTAEAVLVKVAALRAQRLAATGAPPDPALPDVGRLQAVLEATVSEPDVDPDDLDDDEWEEDEAAADADPPDE